MSAQEELEKLEREMRGLVRGMPDTLTKNWADRIATIREGLGKAQEPVAWVCISNDGKTRSLWWRKDQALDRNAGHEFEPLYAAPPADSAQTEKPFKAPGKWFPIDLLGNPMVECEPGRWRSMVSADSAQVLVEALKARADAEYVMAMKIANQPEAKGWVAKVKSGKFGHSEMQAHIQMNKCFGAHESIYAALAAHKSEVKG